ncbi:hypothetical protein Daus18300_013432 [Diaporthe australafricana]|uniref:Heterokaryon incompatibility domain-containing protein n=1 Tax=Diaporthe australafricana TaxID=127596 RepID=A0ABR3VZ18_9PEZI
MLDVLQNSARSCKLCRFFLAELENRFTEWAPDKYKLRLMISLGTRVKKFYPDHSNTGQDTWDCMLLGVFDTRPWQAQPGPKAMMVRRSKQQWESAKPQQQEEVYEYGTRMHCCTEEGDSATYLGLPWLRKIVDYTDSSASLDIANGWLKQCLSVERSGTPSACHVDSQDAESLNDGRDHNVESSTLFPAEQPARLLEILSSDDPDHLECHSVRLIETNGRAYTYAALSYCWGEVADTTWLTKRNTIQQHMQDIDLKSLPATIRDCLHIAASLSVQHVWVDSLCIIQDSASDWETESAKMGGIYRGALLTIAASRSTSSNGGCFNRIKNSFRFIPFAEYTCVESRLCSGQTSRLYFPTGAGYASSQDFSYSEVYGSPLSKRAWVYQEQVLSRRTLYFAGSQLYWECDHCRLSQDNSPQHGVRQYPVLTFSAPLSTSDVVAQWYRGAVEEYTSRGLTNPDDRLVAISAVAKATFLNRRVRYVAGLWEDCILPGLCWHRDGKGQKNTASRCPSWSWASQLSRVTYRALTYRYGEPYQDSSDVAKVLNVQVVSSEKNPFGHVHSGHITLHTRVTTGTVMRDLFGKQNSPLTQFAGADRAALVIPEKSGLRVWQGMAVLDDEGHTWKDVVIALVLEDNHKSEWLLLLLEQTDEKEQTYKRVGLGVLKHDYDSLTEKSKNPNFDRDWTEQAITIV